jgi:ABC-type branched-subunit amino acid transport system substrate-binding protein
MQKVVQSNAQAVLFLASGTVVVEGVAQLRAAGSPAQVVTLSNNASAGFVKALERHAHGVIVCQVFPDERSVGTPMIREAHELARAQGIEDLSPSMLEGFAAAKVLVEGLRRAGKDVCPSSARTGASSASVLSRTCGLTRALEGHSSGPGEPDPRSLPDC